jgi:hypothetical protein
MSSRCNYAASESEHSKRVLLCAFSFNDTCMQHSVAVQLYKVRTISRLLLSDPRLL